MKMDKGSTLLVQLGQKLGKFKYPVIILLLGLVLLALPTKESGVEKAHEPAVPDSSTERTPDDIEVVEERLAAILSQIEGAGEVRVMLRYSASARVIYQTDSSQEVKTSEEEKQTKTEIETVMNSAAGGGETPVSVQTISPIFEGAVIVAQGASRAEVRLNLVNAVSSLTGLGADKITVIKMKSE